MKRVFLKKGASLIRGAAASGHGEAQYRYADALSDQLRMSAGEDGAAQEKLGQDIFAWYLKAAENEHWLAQKNVGHAYVIENGTPIDLTEAEKWYRKAAVNSSSPFADHLHDFGWKQWAAKTRPLPFIASVPAKAAGNLRTSCDRWHWGGEAVILWDRTTPTGSHKEGK